MADTSERIIILSAVVLVIIVLFPNSGLMRPLGTVFDIEVEITTSRDNYTLGESFTATLQLVNNGSKDVWMNPIYELPFLGNSVNDPEPTTGMIDLDWIQGAKIHVPPKSKTQLFELNFEPQYSGEFVISCFGVKKSVLILEPEQEYQVFIEEANYTISGQEAVDKVLNTSGYEVGYRITAVTSSSGELENGTVINEMVWLVGIYVTPPDRLGGTILHGIVDVHTGKVYEVSLIGWITSVTPAG